MNKTKIYACLPVLNESENIPHLISTLKKQSFKNFELIVCINQPDDWWNLDDKVELCIDNQKSIEILKKENEFPIVLIDKSSKGNGWQGKQKGVGWARKLVMDKAASLGADTDLIASIDADTEYPEDYLISLSEIFARNPQISGLANPYYHRLTKNIAANKAILRYEIYMRNYAINMLLIKNPYHFTALGSAMAIGLKTYKRVGGMIPKASGEDFYFLQKLSKFGPLEDWNKTMAYPAARFSDRVNFGTGPAMIKGNAGDWSSYPIYHYKLFQKVEKTYNAFPDLFERDLETPMTSFLQNQLNKEEIWAPLRKNYKSKAQFVKACSTLVDGLRILQFLKQEIKVEDQLQEINLVDNLLYFSTIENIHSAKLKELASVVNLDDSLSMQSLRDALTNFEYSLRQMKSIP